MLFALIPATDIYFAVVKLILSLSLKLVIAELADILNSIRPREFSKSLHLAVFPLALIALAICPVVGACSLNDTFLELARVP